MALPGSGRVARNSRTTAPDHGRGTTKRGEPEMKHARTFTRVTALTVVALGLTAGTAFSLPVAAFVCLFGMILAAFAPYIHHVVMTGVFYIPHEGPMPEVTMLDKLFMGVFKCLSLLVSPITQFDPLGDLSTGRLIPWAQVGKAFLLLVVVGADAVAGRLAVAGWLAA